MTGTEKARLMRRLAELVAENADDLAVVEITDNGKLIREIGGLRADVHGWLQAHRSRGAPRRAGREAGREGQLHQVRRPSRRGDGDGPIAFKEQLEKIQGYVEIGREEGAELVAGGKRPEKANLRDGFFIEPPILTGVDNEMTVARDEIFGPVLSVIPAGSEEEVRLANDTPYGLAAAVWTKDV